ncbi:type IV toxin-antitoxin system AbiEi family antitoxin domain-containing protein [Microbacteriaceae bacterium VKM Ac-2854]|nr:type IV toxin-antitoxin system AbiEi family antitoxin domain-containing protein [Microbacteriaceae bacterium VKM Ac-2854]
MALMQLEGVARTKELVDLGVSVRALAAAVDRGEVVRVRQGMYCIATLDSDARAAARLGGLVAGLSALKRQKVFMAPGLPAGLQVWVGPNAKDRVPPRNVTLFWDRGWSGDGRVAVSTLHALWQVARFERPDVFLVAVESALNRQLIRFVDLDTLVERLPQDRIDIVNRARDSSQSGLESLAAYRLEGSGYDVRRQVPIRGVGVVDLLIGTSLIVELDGESTHDFRADRERDTQAARRRYATLRFHHDQVFGDWEAIDDAVHEYVSLGYHAQEPRELDE